MTQLGQAGDGAMAEDWSHESASLSAVRRRFSRIDVEVGEDVRTGDQVGRVGSTGDATAPHLHFEVRLRGAAVDLLPALK